jgi:Cdc6-like AAA superfamily ATPase
MKSILYVTRVAESLNDRIKKNKASAIVVDGQMGEGKTTFAVMFLEKFQSKRINYDMQYAVGGEDFLKKLELCVDNGLRAIIYDEAGDFGRKATLSKFNRTLDMVFQTFRTYKILIIIVLPFFSELDRGIYDRGVVRGLFNCYSRNEKYGCVRFYTLRRIFFLLSYINVKKPPVRQVAYKKTTPMFQAYFKNLPPERSEELDVISTLQKRERLRQTNEGSGGSFDYEPYVAEVLNNLEKFSNDRGVVTIPKIKMFLGLSDHYARMVREYANVKKRKTQ